MRIITLTTDFGLQDWFVGTMKGVILGFNPRAAIVDITHDIPPGDIRAGAFALAASYRYFPRGTIHVAVVDPGVGTKRNALAVRTRDYTFIGPDNGVLSFALRNEKVKSIRRIANEKLFLHPVSRTFHGRDIFAPVAAHLSRGLAFARVGPSLNDFTKLPWPEPRIGTRGLEGEIIHVDRFGNAITNLPASAIKSHSTIRVRGASVPVVENYQAVPPGHLAAVPGSSDFLELAVNGGSAARKLRLRPSNKVTLLASHPPLTLSPSQKAREKQAEQGSKLHFDGPQE
ncbi:MAG: SAM-dependent chlorinase/fluorinase [Verrucomicrobiota bacterium]